MRLEAIGGPFRYPGLLPLETEVKIRVANLDEVEERLRGAGFRIHATRVFESNVMLDLAGTRLRKKGELLRLRRAGEHALLTYKGPGKEGPHKSREEIETELSDPGAMQQILLRLGFKPGFRYEKYRTEYARPGDAGIVTVDETPIGNFLEIEGAPEWIDSTARELAYTSTDYITMSYAALYLEHCRAHAAKPSDMVFRDRPQTNT